MRRLWELVTDRGAWRAAVRGVAKSRTRPRDWTEDLETNRPVTEESIRKTGCTWNGMALGHVKGENATGSHTDGERSPYHVRRVGQREPSTCDMHPWSLGNDANEHIHEAETDSQKTKL